MSNNNEIAQSHFVEHFIFVSDTDRNREAAHIDPGASSYRVHAIEYSQQTASDNVISNHVMQVC